MKLLEIIFLLILKKNNYPKIYGLTLYLWKKNIYVLNIFYFYLKKMIYLNIFNFFYYIMIWF